MSLCPSPSTALATHGSQTITEQASSSSPAWVLLFPGPAASPEAGCCFHTALRSTARGTHGSRTEAPLASQISPVRAQHFLEPTVTPAVGWLIRKLLPSTVPAMHGL